MAPKLQHVLRPTLLDTTRDDTMLALPRFWAVACRMPFLFQGETLHRAALMSVFQRRFDLAERLFEAAAGKYRSNLDVPDLARLRVHQLIARAQACHGTDRVAALQLATEAEHRLRALDHVEDLAPPFALVAAGDLRNDWRVEPESSSAAA